MTGENLIETERKEMSSKNDAKRTSWSAGSVTEMAENTAVSEYSALSAQRVHSCIPQHHHHHHDITHHQYQHPLQLFTTHIYSVVVDGRFTLNTFHI
jgi:hypothetical protein